MFTLQDIRDAQSHIREATIETPVLALKSDRWAAILPKGADCHLKLELFQQAGSFKGRGAYLGISQLDAERRAAGVVAASGGNHAMAVSWASQAAGVSAKIAIPKAADPLRIEECRSYGADVVLCDDIQHAFAVMEESAQTEGRFMMHPFEAPHMALGAATCGLEFTQQCADVDMFIVPVGGGGLIGGMAAAIKAQNPKAQVFGVEPEGADSMYQSLSQGAPVKLDRITTIADSLASPLAMPMTFDLARQFVDGIARVPDDALRQGMKLYQDVLRIVAEPACAASLAALVGPLAAKAEGQKVGIIACGSNISLGRYRDLLG